MPHSSANLPDWTFHAEPISGVIVEVGFHVAEDFYYGPANGFTTEEWESLRVPLYRPSLPLRNGFVLADDVANAPEELVRYYADVVRLLDEHGKSVKQTPHLFWLRPFVLVGDEDSVTFPWSGTWDDVEQVLEALAAEGPGVVFRDVDQGWEVEIAVSGSRLFIRQADPETGDESVCVSCGRDAVALQAQRLHAQGADLLRRVRSELGHDYWSRPAPSLVPPTGIQPWHLAALLALAAGTAIPFGGLALMYGGYPVLAAWGLLPATAVLVLVRPWAGSVAAAVVSSAAALLLACLLAWVMGTADLGVMPRVILAAVCAPLVATALAAWGAVRLRRALVEHLLHS